VASVQPVSFEGPGNIGGEPPVASRYRDPFYHEGLFPSRDSFAAGTRRPLRTHPPGLEPRAL